MCLFSLKDTKNDVFSFSQDALMLSGDESPQRHLKEALLTLEELKEKSGILYCKNPRQPGSTERHPLSLLLEVDVEIDQDWPFVDTSSHRQRNEARVSPTHSGQLWAGVSPNVMHFLLSALFFSLDFFILNWASRVATATGEMSSSVGVCGSGGAWRKCV